jgi:GT2 family glycosyltransferase
MLASVIIPTYNRKDSLRRALDGLRNQTLPSDCYEAIIADDGSTDGTGQLLWNDYPFQVHYYRQENAGAAMARNMGADHSLAEVLVFMDDDIVATPATLEHLVLKLRTSERLIVLGTLIPALDDSPSLFGVKYSEGTVFPGDLDDVSQDTNDDLDGCYMHFIQCKTGVLSIKRQDFYDLSMFQDPTDGWPNWDDVDFGYRAHLQGFRLWRCHSATAYHHDHALESLESSCKRLEQLSKSAAQLLERYPELRPHLAYRDKEPMSFQTDSPELLVRKALRSLMSGAGSVRVMRRLAATLERHRADSPILVLLYRWILSAYMYRGYRQGLCELSTEHETIN